MSRLRREASFFSLQFRPDRQIDTPCDAAACRRRLMMTFLTRLLSRRPANMQTVCERKRFARTMPGQTAAIAANKYGCLVA